MPWGERIKSKCSAGQLSLRVKFSQSWDTCDTHTHTLTHCICSLSRSHLKLSLRSRWECEKDSCLGIWIIQCVLLVWVCVGFQFGHWWCELPSYRLPSLSFTHSLYFFLHPHLNFDFVCLVQCSTDSDVTVQICPINMLSNVACAEPSFLLFV